MKYLLRIPCKWTASLLTLAVLLSATTVSVHAQQQAALGAEVVFNAIDDGSVLNELPRNTPFSITVKLQNHSGAEAPAGLFLNGWLRPVSDTNLECKSAARAYRATQRTPMGSIDLNGPAIGVVTDDGNLTIADPELNLASANLVGAASFGEVPADFVADPGAARYLVSLASAGEVKAITVFGGRSSIIASGLDSPSTIVPAGNGSIWILEQGSGDVLLLDNDGTQRRLKLDAIDMRTGWSGKTIAIQSAQTISVFDQQTGREIAELDLTAQPYSHAINDFALLEGDDEVFALAILGSQRLSIYYLDSLADPISVELADSAKNLAIDPQGRFAFAYSADRGATSIVDISRGQLVQVVGSGAPVAEIEFSDNAAFMMLADQSMVGVMDLASIRPGKHAEVREVALGAAEADTDADTLHLMSRLLPGNEMLAVHASSYTGFVVHETSAMGDSPPMSAVRLRGGTPQFVEVIDRGFQEVHTGTFTSTAMLPDDGQFELVVTTGIGSMSACMPLAIAQAAQTNNTLLSEQGSLSVVPVSGSATEHRLRLTDSLGNPAILQQAEVTFRALETHWLARETLVTDNQGVSKEVYELPALGEIVVTVQTVDDRAYQQPGQFDPLLLTVKP